MKRRTILHPSQDAKVKKATGADTQERRSTSPSFASLVFMRLVIVSVVLLCYIRHEALQGYTDWCWSYLCSTWLYNSVYFETWWATVCYGLILAVPYLVDKISIFHRYKIDPSLKWQSAGIKKIALEAVEYCAPLMLLDTFTIKKYYNVDPVEWSLRRQTWVQHTRALPVAPPTVFQIVYQLLLSFIIYDLIFFIVHYALHKNLWLYKTVHASHHEHSLVHSRVTNQLSVAERITLVLSANEALKLVRSHPLTRTLFVPIFIGMLVENHCGYDLPFTLDKVIPFNLFGGAAQHYKHHVHSSRNYQPFFTYIDRFLDAYAKWKKKRSKTID